MADEVTKKDLQSLQGYVNKKIADLKTVVDKATSDISILQELPTKQDQAIAKALNAIESKFDMRFAELKVAIDALKKKE